MRRNGALMDDKDSGFAAPPVFPASGRRARGR